MASELTLRQLRYFLAAVDGGSMAEAGRALHVSASAVSLAVAALEDALGDQLLLRVPHRPLALTAAGAAALADARRLVAAADELVARARQRSDAVTGRLRVGCFATLAPIYAPALIAGVADVHPGLELEVEELFLEEMQEALLLGRLELALLYDLHIRPEVATEVLTVTRPYVVVAGTHRLAARRSVRLRELIDEPMIMLDVPPSRPYFTALLDGLGLRPRIGRTTHSFETLRSLVARNLGWALLIQQPAVDLSYEGLALQPLRIADDLPTMPIVLARADGARLSRRAEAFRALCRQTVGRVGR